MNQKKAGIIISYFNLSVHTIIGILYVPLLLWYIGKAEYGLYQLIGSLIAYFSIMDFGLTNAVIRFYTKYKMENNTIKMENILAIAFRCYLVISSICIILGIGIYVCLDNIFPNMTSSEIMEAKDIFALLLVNIAITLLSLIFRAIITSNEKFVFLKGMESIELVIQPILVVVLLESYPSAFTVALVQTILNVVLASIRCYYCIIKLHVTIRFHYWDQDMLVNFRKLAVSIFLVTIVDQIFFKTNQVVLGIISGTVAVAVYSIAALIYMNYMALSNAMVGVYLPHVTKMIAACEPVIEFSRLFLKIGRLQFFLLMAISSTFVIFGKEFIFVWAGDGFEEAYWITLLIIVPFTIDLIQNIGLTIMQAKNQYGFRAKVYIIMGIANIILSIYWGSIWSGIGCAAATGLVMLLGNGIVMNWYYNKVIGLDIFNFWKEIGRILSYVLVLTIVGGIINNPFATVTEKNMYHLFLKIGIYLLIYFLVIYRFAMNTSEKKIVHRVLSIKAIR